MTEKQIDKEVNRRAIMFKQKVKNGLFLDGEKITLKEFDDKRVVDYAEKQLASKILVRYKKLLKRINESLGHIKLSKLQPKDGNKTRQLFYTDLFHQY